MDKKWLGFLGLLVLISLPLVQAQPQPPNDCLAYAFTRSDAHSFLLENNSYAYGNQIFIRTDCQDFSVYFDNEFYANYQNQNSASIFIPNGTLNMTIQSGNYTYYAQNIMVFENQFSWTQNYITYQRDLPELTFIELGKITFQENVVSLASILIVWFLSVNIYWALINHYLDRNLFEEVKE